MQRARVGVFRGGPSEEYDVSLATGGAVLRNLNPEKYEGVDVFVDRDGYWHVLGFPTSPQRIAHQIDVAFNALHGHYGEDGQVQRHFEQFDIPYTGSGVAPSAHAMNKERTKQIFAVHGIKTPVHTTLSECENSDEQVFELFRSMSGPYVVKPTSGGSSLGIYMADNLDELKLAIEYAFGHEAHKVMVEEYIAGREATCGVIDNFRDEAIYALPPVEIVPPVESPFFDYNAKYSGETQEIVPGNFSPEEKENMQEIAIDVHKALGLRHYSRTDFIVSPRGIYTLEVNTLPGLTKESLLPKAVGAIGLSFPDFLDHLVTLALERK